MSEGREKQRGDLPLPPGSSLGLWDAVSIIVGIVIGASIYQAPADVMKKAGDPWIGLAVWAVGGGLTLLGALCYAELASAYPGQGGDYDYLTRAFGPWMGFFFGWAQLAVIRTSNIGNMAIVFAAYALSVFVPGGDPRSWVAAAFALAAIFGLTLLNALGVLFGKTIQNVLTIAKVLGLSGILIAGFGWGDARRWNPASDPPTSTVAVTALQTSESALPSSDFDPADGTPSYGWNSLLGLLIPMISVLYAYGGWNDAVLVAAEVRNRQRNLPLALLLGTGGIVVVYLLINAAFLLGLGFDRMARSTAVAADVLALPLGPVGSNVMAVLVMISALGATNGLIFTGSPVYARMGQEHWLFSWLGSNSTDGGHSVPALFIQGLISCLMIVTVATPFGQGAINSILVGLMISPIAWQNFPSPFEALVFGAAPVFWLFFFLTGLSVVVLRCTDRATERPFLVPLYPLVPAAFCLTCLAMMYSAVRWAGALTLLGLVPLACGVPMCLLLKPKRGTPQTGPWSG